MSVSPSQTPILMFSFPADTKKHQSFLLTVRSGRANRKKCVFVAISDPDCPWNDEQRTLKNNKILSRILSLGYFPLRSEDFQGGFIMIFKATENSKECSSDPLEETEQISEEEPKTLTISVTRIPSSFRQPVTVTLVVFAVLGISMTTVLTYCWHQKAKYQDRNPGGPEDSHHNLEVEVETTVTTEGAERAYKQGMGSFSLFQSSN